MTHEVQALLNQYRTLWRSYLTSPQGEEAKRQLIELMEQVRDHADLSDEDWEAFTSTLPGFDEWWLRVRGEYLDYLDRCVEDMEAE